MIDEEDEGGRKPNRCTRILYVIWKIFTCLFTHVMLVSMVVSYCILGAVTFESLEKEHELEVKKNISYMRNNVTEDLWTMTREMDVLRQYNWTQKAISRIKLFENDLVLAMKKGGWDGTEGTEVRQWTFAGALFYSIIVITTIGYGHIAPKTQVGKVTTIFYAVVGIPLMLLCLSNIGSILAQSFRFLYWKVCCYSCTKEERRSSTRRKYRRNNSYMSSRSRRSNSEMDDAQYYSEGESISTISRNPNSFQMKSIRSPHNDRRKRQQSVAPSENVKDEDEQSAVICNQYVLDAKDAIRGIESGSTSGISLDTSKRNSEMMRSKTPKSIYSDSPPPMSQSRGEAVRPVPIWLCGFLVVSYIVGGAFLFSDWEDWNYTDSAYFCFITLTTIGFGDYVPAQRVNKQNAEMSIALCSLYLLFGIALLAMSFNLVQEEVISNVKAVARHLGIIKDTRDDQTD